MEQRKEHSKESKKDFKRQHKPEKTEEPKKAVDDKGFKHLVRVAGVVLNGNMRVTRALMKIRGIGPEISRCLTPVLNIEKNVKLGNLDEKQIEGVENVINHLENHVPQWMLNRQRDYDTGKNLHLIGADLDFVSREDINRQKKMRSYKGIRHGFGLPVRGQRTRTTGRKGPAVGVSRKKALAATAQPAQQQQPSK